MPPADLKLNNKRHTLAHLLAAAVLELYPDAKATIGPVIDNGFYYDFEFVKPIIKEDLKDIEKRMCKFLPYWSEVKGSEVNAKKAREIFKENSYKLELIEEIISKDESITVYTAGVSAEGGAAPFIDLCRGGHAENPAKEIAPDSFKLTHIAGAYWRGSEKNKMLTRIYGLAFNSKKELDDYEKHLEEAAKRDHKKLGKELDLFTFSDLVGPGLPLWTPKGTIMREILDDFVWELRQKYGYEKVEIPHITKKDLYEKSGHWDKFKDELFKIITREGHVFAMKPMSCPHHTQIYARKLHSYKELPQRYANTTMVYRDEQSGELAGLSRVRCITQDDAHVFCRHSQVEQEVINIWDIINTFYGAFGFVLTPKLSLHDQKHMEKYLGTEDIWRQSEDTLRKLMKSKGVNVIEVVGEAAFYGPKIDFMAKDSLGREWQVATIQLDMNLPERFDLDCNNEKGVRERIVMIHAAVMGSIERFMSIIIEHYGGNFPLWLAPVQVKVIPVGESHFEVARKIHELLRGSFIRSEFDISNDGFGKKVRNAKTARIPYFIIIGDKDIQVNKVTLESRDNGQIGQLTENEVLEKLREEIQKRK
ncbi:MAG: threonine--tRNA ligase [Patescibacteria group bacterium]